MQVLCLVLFTILLEVVPCTYAAVTPQFIRHLLGKPNQDSIKEHIKAIVQANSPKFALHTADTTKTSAALISLAEEGSISTVENFFELLSKRQSFVPTELILLVITGVSIQVAAKLLQTSLTKCLQVKYKEIRGKDIMDLLEHFHIRTDLFDRDHLSLWLRETSSSELPQSGPWFEYLVTHAGYEFLKTAYDKLDPSTELGACKLFLSAITKIERRMDFLLTLFTQDSNMLPFVIVGIINTYITADE